MLLLHVKSFTEVIHTNVIFVINDQWHLSLFSQSQQVTKWNVKYAHAHYKIRTNILRKI